MRKSGWIKEATEERLTVVLDGGLEACSGCGQAISGESGAKTGAASCPGCSASAKAPHIDIPRMRNDGVSVGDRIEIIDGNASLALQAFISLGIPILSGFAAFFALRALFPSLHPGFDLLVAFALVALVGGALQNLAGKRLRTTRYVKLPLEKKHDL